MTKSKSKGRWERTAWSDNRLVAGMPRVRLSKAGSVIEGNLYIEEGPEASYTVGGIRVPLPGTYSVELWVVPGTAERAPLFSYAMSIESASKGVVKIEENSWVRVGGGTEPRGSKVNVLRDSDIDMEYRLIYTTEGDLV